MRSSYDFVIVGAGVIGLTLARELALRKAGTVLVLEKEPEVGRHASGRNSGVVHAGIYYPPGSLKAKFCVSGAELLLAYVKANSLPLLECGKVIVANKPEHVPALATLLSRAQKNGVQVEKVSLERLRELEPEAKSHEYALWSPRTAVIDSKAVLKHLVDEIRGLGVELCFGEDLRKLDVERAEIFVQGQRCTYGFLYNTAGVYADRLAQRMGVGRKYRILPFKGLYWKASAQYASRIRRLIYPTPDINMPFLGIHITLTVDGKVLFGPTAIPAFGRENYSLLGGLDLVESPQISWQLAKLLVRNPDGFRGYVDSEIKRYRPRHFFAEAKSLVHDLKREDIGEFYKVGIRAQLLDLEKGRLEMDFVIEEGPRSLHVLNAISPAFTSAFAFAEFLVSRTP